MGPQRYDFPIYFSKLDVRPVTLNGGGGEQRALLGDSSSPAGWLASPLPLIWQP